MLAGHDVSRETQPARRSLAAMRAGEARSVKGARVRQRLFEAALGLISEGTLRPGFGEVALRAGVRTNAINEQFGYHHLFLRQLLRERMLDVLAAMDLPPALTAQERVDMAWMIVTGGRRPDVTGSRS